MRIDIRQVGETIEGKDETVGKYSRAKVAKNKCACPNGVAQIPIIWGVGIDRASELLDELLLKGVITKSSSYFSYRDIKVNGKQNMIDHIRNNMSEFEKYLEGGKSVQIRSEEE